MKNLDKEFNRRFQYEKAPSDEPEVEALWAAVESELEEDSDKGAFYYLRFVGLLTLLTFTMGVGFWMLSSEEQRTFVSNDLDNQETQQNSSVIMEEECPTVPPRNDMNLDAKQINTGGSERKLNEDANTNQSIINPQIKSSLEKNESTVFSKKNEIEANKNLTKSKKQKVIAFTDSNVIDVMTKKAKLLALSDSKRVNETSASTPNRLIEKKIYISEWALSPVLTPREITLKNERIPLPDTQLFQLKLFSRKSEKQELPDDKVENIDFIIGVGGGLNWSNQTYKHSSNPTFSSLKNSTERGDFGQSYGVNIAMVFKNRWLIKSGLEYHNFWTKFNYTNIKIDPILKEDQLVKVWVNGADTLKVEYGDVTVNKTSTREVVHHNKYTQISIPFEFGFQGRTEKISYGGTIGAALNFLLHQSGKNIDELSGITVYNNDLANNPLSDFKIGLRISPFVSYHLSKKLTLSLQPNLMLQQQKNIRQTNLSAQVQQLSLRLGLQMRL